MPETGHSTTASAVAVAYAAARSPFGSASSAAAQPHRIRSRRSPVCLLDEVDAALDEANNDRFNRLVREFIDTSQFVIITHAKRTMSMANVLYGVTMQEAGVSKRISVRFEEAAEVGEEQLEPAGT